MVIERQLDSTQQGLFISERRERMSTFLGKILNPFRVQFSVSGTEKKH